MLLTEGGKEHQGLPEESRPFTWKEGHSAELVLDRKSLGMRESWILREGVRGAQEKAGMARAQRSKSCC